MAKQEPQYYYPPPTAPPPFQSTAYHAPSGGHVPPPTLGFCPPNPAHVVPPPMSAASPHPPQLSIPIVPQIPTQGVAGQWSTGLCDCGDDVGLCCLTCWCPCITFGRIAEIVDRGSGSCGTSGALYGLILAICASMGLPGLQCIYSCSYRSKMRAQYNLAEDPCVDCCVHCWCEPCALCQEYKELSNRGYDMAIGWEGNLRKFQDAAAGTTFGMPPPVQKGMNR